MATTEQFSLRWNNFHSNLTTGFHELLEAADMVDVTLAVDGHFLQAHKIVLSICSPFFKQMFKVNPCKHPIVILKDVGHENMKDILEFMYMGQVSVLRENLTQFLRTAELLQVKGLTGDDSEESSSTKDMKSECDNEDENEMYNQLIETDMELPLYQPNTQMPNVPLGKRNKTSSSCTNTKRSKSDYQHSLKPVKEELEQAPLKDYTTLKSENTVNSTVPTNTSTDNSYKEPLNMKMSWESVSSGPTDPNCSSESDALQNSADSKNHVFCPYCYRKFVNRYNLKVHVRDKHETNFTDLDCQICGKTMRNQSCLRVHMYHHRKQQLDGEGLISGIPNEVA